MRLLFLILATALGGTSIGNQVRHSQDLPIAGSTSSEFKFHPDSGCINKAGVPGYNPGFQGECGDLRGFKLHGANLQGALLMNAALRGTDLKSGDLSNATLIGADFGNADLRGANLSGAQLGEKGKVIALPDLDTSFRPTQFKGARFDEKTLLPFDRKENRLRGMVLVQEKTGEQLILRPIEVDFGDKAEKRSRLNK